MLRGWRLSCETGEMELQEEKPPPPPAVVGFLYNGTATMAGVGHRDLEIRSC